MRLRYFSESALSQLKTSVGENKKLYSKENNEEFFSYLSDPWWFESETEVENFELLEPGDGKNFDVENTKIVFEKMKNINVLQAADERLWAYLTHVEFWNYMIKRWPEAGKGKAFILERYFLSGKPRGFFRNGLARLWWYGFASYDSEGEDPFSLTEVMVSDLDIAQNLTERSFSQNKDFTLGFLSALKYFKQEGEFVKRENVRELLKFFNRFGGVNSLDFYSKEEIQEMAEEKLLEIIYG